MSERKHSLNIKLGDGYEAPLWSIGYDSLPELETELRAIHANQGIIDMAASISVLAQAKYREAGGGRPARPPQNDQSQQAVQQSASASGDIPKCKCGKYLEKKPTKNGDKLYWRCMDWRYNNGNPNDSEHDSYKVE